MKCPPCRCCGSTEVLYRGAKRGRHTFQEFRYYQCRPCDFMFVEPVTGFEIYDDAYYRGEGADPSVDYESEYQDYARTPRIHEFRDLAQLVADSLKPELRDGNVRWLDYGCGAGGFLKYLRDRGRLIPGSTTGIIEPIGHDVGSYAQRLQGEGLRILDLDSINSEPAGSYDVVSMIEVLEHVPNPASPVLLAARLLRPGGLLVVTTGNLASPAAKSRGLAFSYCIPEIHVSLFSPSSLNGLYLRCGFRPRPVRYRGVITFKVLKSFKSKPLSRMASIALSLPPLRTWIDRRYGVSAMPWAVRNAD